MNIANIKIGHRLTIAFSLTIALLAVVVTVGATRLNTVGGEIGITIHDRYAKISLLNDLKDASNRQARDVRNALMQEGASDEIRGIADGAREADGYLVKLDAMVQDQEPRALLQGITSARRAYADSVAQLTQKLQAGDRAGANTFMVEHTRTLQQACFDAIEKLIAFQVQQMQDSGAAAQQTAHAASLIMVVLGITGGVLSLVTAWFITRGIVQPIGHAVKVARTVADGDLGSTIEVRSTDEVGELSSALQDMNNSLVRIVSEVRVGTDAIRSASSEIAVGNADLSLRTEQQASSLEETATSMEELTATVKHNADNARQANQLAQSASAVASQGGEVVAQVVETMAAINESSRRIFDIVGVIDSIAFQTNILALNAAVEAARAGEQGRGFAVVASEVRSLAGRSAAAAREIKTLIGASVERVDNGAKLVDQAGHTMGEIVASVRRVTDIIGEIAEASNGQLSGIEQVNAAISEMDENTQRNAALVEQASAAANAMREQAMQLSATVGVFRLGATAFAQGTAATAVATARPTASVSRLSGRRPAPRRLAAPAAASDDRATGT